MVKKKTIQQFIEEAKNIYGDKYDYSESVYINTDSKINIICKIHGVFFQRASAHLYGNGCKKCAQDKDKKTRDEFILESYNIHGDRYDYSLVDYKTAHCKVLIRCKNMNILNNFHMII